MISTGYFHAGKMETSMWKKFLVTATTQQNVWTTMNRSLKTVLSVQPVRSRHLEKILQCVFAAVSHTLPSILSCQTNPLTRPSIKALTHLHLKKLAAILADAIFNYIFLNEDDKVLIHISMKYFPMCPIGNKPALVQVMAWRQRCDKPLPRPMRTQIIDAYVWH